MPDRSSPGRATPRDVSLVINVVLFTPRGSELAVLLVPNNARSRTRDRAMPPSDSLLGDESIDQAASRIAREALGIAPSFLHQAAADGSAARQQEHLQISITYFGLVPNMGATRTTAQWAGLSELGALTARQREQVDAAVTAMRAQVDQQPIAFRLVPPTFTLSELQGVYEMLLGRRLHKASFRRSLHASALVEATDEWRGDGRGRPAQLFRYAPPRRRRPRRGIRFDLL
jgi:8-oxo-dGTP diphosphatase